jgi:hypothetical protein
MTKNFTDFKKEFSSYTNSFGTATGVINEPDIFKNINTLYGVPMCALDIVKSALIRLLPSSFLNNISNKFQDGFTNASKSMNAKVQGSFLQNGLFKYNPDTGRFEWAENDGLLGTDDLGFLGEMSLKLAEIQGNVAFYANSINGTLNQIDDFLNCIGKYLAWESSKSEYNNVNSIFGPVLFLEDQLAKDADFLKSIAEGQEAVTLELKAREENPFLEPLVLEGDIKDPSPFRLVYGPPKSTTGQFLLSIDGIYYDSQKGGIPFVDYDSSSFLSASSIPSKDKEWELNFSPNLGGKGDSISFKTIDEYRDTIFSLDVIDNSPSMKEIYSTDALLNKLEGQRNLEIGKLNSAISELLLTYAEDSALVVNSRQSLHSVSSKYSEKISKRKKQVELYVKYSPGYVKGDSIPVNDFSFITNSIVAPEIDKQKKLVFMQGELDGVILPVAPKYVKAADSSKVSSFSHLFVGDIGSGEISFISDHDSSTLNITNLNDSIVTDKLIAVYNFLDSTIGTKKTSYNLKDYKTVNYNGIGNFAQLVGTGSDVYVSGLTIPKLDGIVSDSYMLLQDSNEFRDMAYKKDGFTIDFWTHIPDITSSGSWLDKSYRRVLLSCDNVGGDVTNYQSSSLIPSKGSNSVRGLQIGFATHRQLAKGLEYSTVDAENDPANQLVFYVAPTQSYGPSSVGFINKVDGYGCVTSANDLYSLVIDTSATTSGVMFNDASGEFINISLTVDPLNDLVKVYVDSVEIASQDINSTFGIPAGHTLQVPSPIKENSYNPYSGPVINPSLLTPWVVGSSFVDNLLSLDSGYKAHIGSLKFYSKSLNSSEVLKNYNAQQGYFKNIAV